MPTQNYQPLEQKQDQGLPWVDRDIVKIMVELKCLRAKVDSINLASLAASNAANGPIKPQTSQVQSKPMNVAKEKQLLHNNLDLGMHQKPKSTQVAPNPPLPKAQVAKINQIVSQEINSMPGKTKNGNGVNESSQNLVGGQDQIYNKNNGMF